MINMPKDVIPEVGGKGGFRATVASLGAAQKRRARGAPAYSIYINRPLGRYLAAIAYRLGLTSNAVSGISALFTFSAIILIAAAPPTLWLGIVVWLLLAFGYLLDSADGQVARLRGGGSPSGEWLDHVLDAAKNSSIHLAVLITSFVHFDLYPIAWLLVPIGFSVVSAVTFLAMLLNDQLKARYRSQQEIVERPSTPLRALMGLPTDYGILCMAFLLLGWPAAFFVVYAFLFLANTGYLLLASAKWFHDMKTLATLR
jgi:phosphatidylglycerophosphate synthase